MMEDFWGAHRALSKYDFVLYFCSYLNNFSSLVEKEHIINMFISPQSQEKVVFCLNSNGRVLGNFVNLCSEQIPENWNFLESRKIRRKARSSCVTEVSVYKEYQWNSPATSQACINLQIISSFLQEPWIFEYKDQATNVLVLQQHGSMHPQVCLKMLAHVIIFCHSCSASYLHFGGSYILKVLYQGKCKCRSDSPWHQSYVEDFNIGG